MKMQKSYMKKSLLTIVVFCLLMMFCIPFVGVFAEETTEPDKTPNFKFLNTPYKGVTVKLNTYDYTDYWDKIHTEEQFSKAETKTDFHSIDMGGSSTRKNRSQIQRESRPRAVFSCASSSVSQHHEAEGVQRTIGKPSGRPAGRNPYAGRKQGGKNHE